MRSIKARSIKVRRERAITLSLLLGVSLVGLSLMLARPPVSRAATTLTVTSSADSGGTCPGADCTLRQAILVAVSGDTINFAAGLSTITLTSDELLINKTLTINGPGANLLSVQRSAAAGNFRIFEIAPNSVIATISGLTVANGNPSGTGGGGIYNNGGTLTVSNSTVSGNSAGGIYNSGSLTLTNSTISGNSTGGVSNFSGSTMAIINSTISDNVGNGILNVGTLTITNSTISGNSVSTSGSGGGIFAPGGRAVNVRNTIIAKNTAGRFPDVDGTLNSQGYNLIGNTSGAAITGTTGDQLNVDPKLGPLQDNGGPTKTQALLSGSTAIEGGNSSGSNTDQRGFARPVDDLIINNASGSDGSDIGAYEVQADQLPGCNTINRVVNNNNDGGTDSLRTVIASVCAGSTITFAPNVRGAINLTSGELLINKSLTISGPGANVLSVQRNASAGNFRIFNIAPASVIATISGLTIANGNSPGSNSGNGGGIYNNGATLTVSNSTISGNSAGSGAGGGGVFNSVGTLTIVNSTLSGNSASFGGGGINNFRGTVTVSNSTISGNTINGGNGGGIYTTGDSTTGVLDITNSTISGNSASDSGSGLGVGGGIHNGGGTVSLTSCTVSGNTAQFRGGGVNGSLSSKNTIIALNTSPSGPDVFGALNSQGFNLIGNNSGATITPAQFSDQIGVTAAQLNLGPLQDNSGPTQTRALLSGSFAIDKGNSSGSTSDQRGFTRPVGSANVSGGDGSDIGAFEVQLNCSYSINPISQAFPASSGTGSVSVTAAAGCAWTAASNASFVTITSGASGTGNGTVTYTVAANTGPARTGTLTVAGQTVTITQASGCTYTLTPTTQNFPASVAAGAVSVTTSGGCAWTAQSNASFITITSGASGTGNGTVNYSLTANSSTSSRSGTLTIAGQTFTVTQDGVSCSYSISPTSNSVSAAAATGNITVTATSGCAWTAASNDSFITITSGTSGTGNGTVSYTVAANVSTAPRTGTLRIAGQTFTVTQDAAAPTPTIVQLSATSYNVNEGDSFATLTVTRSGDLSAPSTVKYATSDLTDVNFRCDPTTPNQITGVASRKCDYHIAVGRLRFAPGETTKQIIVSIIDDVYVEGPETFNLTLSNPTGATLGANTTAAITILDNDTVAGAANPIDGTRFFVRQLYVDLLSREPDPAGWAGWIHRIDFCGQPGEPPPPCDRVTVGGDGFLRSAEFFDRQFFVLRLYRTGLGRIPQYSEVGDLAYVSGFLSSSDLELNKQELVADLMSRSEFSSHYNGLSNQGYVDALLQTAGVTVDQASHDAWVAALNNNSKTRAQVYREVSERQEVIAKYTHEAQVISAYYGFFTRNPDGAYFNFLQRLDSGEINQADLANAFINAAEYRQRFGQ